jgi:hypothetical protein
MPTFLARVTKDMLEGEVVQVTLSLIKDDSTVSDEELPEFISVDLEDNPFESPYDTDSLSEQQPQRGEQPGEGTAEDGTLVEDAEVVEVDVVDGEIVDESGK